MAELNNRKRELSSERSKHETQADASQKLNTNENGPINSIEVKFDSDTTSSAITETGRMSLISKSTTKSLSRFLHRNVFDTIGKKTSLLYRRRALRNERRGSLRTLNQGWDAISILTSLDDGDNPQPEEREETTQTRKQSLHKNYTFKLRNLREKFKTNRELRKDRFRSLQTASKDPRFRKELNQSMVDNNKQSKLLEKLLEKHNKHLEKL